MNDDRVGGEEAATASAFAGRGAQMFPRLSPVQIARLSAHGHKITMRQNEVLAEPGDRGRPMFVVLSGSIEVMKPGLNGDTLVVLHRAGSFSGDVSILRGIGGVLRMRVREAGEALAID